MNELFTGIILLIFGAFITAYFLSFWEQTRIKSSKKKLRMRLEQIAAHHGLMLSEADFFQYKIIAVDKLKNKIIFIDETTGEEMIIDLNSISECRLIQKQLSSQLELVLKDGYEESICIPFYRRYHDKRGLRKKLSIKAGRWKEIIDNALLLKAETFPAF